HHHQHDHARQRLPVLAVGAVPEARLQSSQQRGHRRYAYCRPAGATPEPECAQISSSRSRPRSSASTHWGSNSLPLCPEMKSSASSKLHARLYGRTEISASKTSATATILASTGISSPASPSG